MEIKRMNKNKKNGMGKVGFGNIQGDDNPILSPYSK